MEIIYFPVKEILSILLPVSTVFFNCFQFVLYLPLEMNAIFQPLSKFHLAAFITLIAFGPVFGQDEAEAVIPSSFPVSRYQEEWNHSAFHREVVAQVSEKKIGPSFIDSLKLEGLVMDAKGPVAYVRDTSTNKSLVITKLKADHSFQIIVANMNPNPGETSVTISNGKETADLKYETSILTAPIKVSRPAVKSAATVTRTQPRKVLTGQPVNGTINLKVTQPEKTAASGSKAIQARSKLKNPARKKPLINLPRGR